MARHGADAGGPLFRPVRNPGGTLDRPPAGTNAQDHEAELAGVQAWCARARRRIVATKLYDRRHRRPADRNA